MGENSARHVVHSGKSLLLILAASAILGLPCLFAITLPGSLDPVDLNPPTQPGKKPPKHNAKELEAVERIINDHVRKFEAIQTELSSLAVRTKSLEDRPPCESPCDPAGDIDALKSHVAALETANDNLQQTTQALQGRLVMAESLISQLEDRIEAAERQLPTQEQTELLSHMRLQKTPDPQPRFAVPAIVFSGVNLQIVNGLSFPVILDPGSRSFLTHPSG